MAGNHFLRAMLSAPCGRCCQRDDENLASYCSSQGSSYLMCFPTEGKSKKKRRPQQAGAVAFLSLASPQLQGLPCVVEVSVWAAQSMLSGQLLINQQRQQAGETLKRYAMKYLKKAANLVFF